jgi:hypothetical protein
MTKRLAEPPENDHCTPFQISQFQVSFGMPVWVTAEDQDKFYRVFDAIISAPYNQRENGCHWLAGCGSKPHYSVTDSLFLGQPIEEGAPYTGEPTFEDEVYFMESVAREFVSDDERKKVVARREREAKEGRGEVDILDMMRDEFQRIIAKCTNHPDDPHFKEIAGLCHRAKNTISQRHPVIEQLEYATQVNREMGLALERIAAKFQFVGKCTDLADFVEAQPRP